MILQEIQDFRRKNKQNLDVIKDNADQRIEQAESCIGAMEA